MRTIYNINNIENISSDHAQIIADLDIYYQPTFLEIEANYLGGKYELFFYQEGSDLFIYPYIVRALDVYGVNAVDVTSPYGYAGPYSKNSDKNFFKRAEADLLNYFGQIGVVTEFVRYHHIYNHNSFFEQNMTNSLNRQIVTLDLCKERGLIWEKQFSSKCRNFHRRMEREGYLFEFVQGVDKVNAFYNLYIKTMDQLNAAKYYYFNFEYINRLMMALGSRAKLCQIRKDDEIYAMAIFFISGNMATYYLSARNLNFQKINATSFLLSSASLRLKEDKKLQMINYGGGSDASPDNSLLAFKKNFSSDERSFFIGKRIHRQDLYAEIAKKYIDRYGEPQYLKVKHILQYYRMDE